MSIGRAIARSILGIIVLGCIGISAVFAFEFGFGKGMFPVHQYAFGLAGGGLDLLKAALPIIAAAAFGARRWLAWAAFAVLTGMSLWCAFGTTAGQLAERVANKAVARSERSQAEDRLSRLRAERARFASFTETSAGAVAAALKAVEAAEEQKRAECGNGDPRHRGPNCRAREADERKARDALLKVQGDKDATDKASALEQKIEAAEKALEEVDTKTAEGEVDPQAASLSKATGWDADKIAMFSHALFAIGIEIGSGLGLWLIFGHGETKRREPEPQELEPRPQTVDTPAELRALAPAAAAPMTAQAIRARFFEECVLIEKDGKVSGKILFDAYATWCARNGFDPMTANAFGMDSPWKHKARSGKGAVYLHCALVPGLVPEPAKREPKPAVIELAKPQLRLVASSAVPAVAG